MAKNIGLGLHLLFFKSQIEFAGQHEDPSEQQTALKPGQQFHPLGPLQHLLSDGQVFDPSAVQLTGRDDLTNPRTKQIKAKYFNIF